MSKCILCSRCISVCRDLAEKYLFSTAYQVFRSKVVVDFDVSLDKEICRDCSALHRLLSYNRARRHSGPMDKTQEEKKRQSRPPADASPEQRGNLLPVLNKAQANPFIACLKG